jgi:DNA end-binding protein Ku
VWTGAISFGLVSVPIAVLGATEDHSVHFRRIHTADNGLVRNHYWCEIEDREVSYGQIGQGYEMAGGRIIPLTDDELRQLPLPTARAIELVGFLLPAADVELATALVAAAVWAVMAWRARRSEPPAS